MTKVQTIEKIKQSITRKYSVKTIQKPDHIVTVIELKYKLNNHTNNETMKKNISSGNNSPYFEISASLF